MRNTAVYKKAEDDYWNELKEKAKQFLYQEKEYTFNRQTGQKRNKLGTGHDWPSV